MTRRPLRRILLPAALLLLTAPPAWAAKTGEVSAESFRLLGEGAALVNRGGDRKAAETLQRVTNMALNSYRA